mmetsp:Transcript_13968/g.21127  ORF Transcript_13968/g.21127 Transcript_13968/m.21127 type:complete len:346 (+) Transcript_13968:208-1245(+)
MELTGEWRYGTRYVYRIEDEVRGGLKFVEHARYEIRMAPLQVREKGWLHGLFSNGAVIKLRHNSSTDQIHSHYRKADEEQWGPEIIARRRDTSDEKIVKMHFGVSPWPDKKWKHRAHSIMKRDLPELLRMLHPTIFNYARHRLRVGQNVVSQFSDSMGRMEKGLYPATILGFNEDGSVELGFDDGDYMARCPRDWMIPRLRPRLSEDPKDFSSEPCLAPETIKGLQCLMAFEHPEVKENGKLDEITVKTLALLIGSEEKAWTSKMVSDLQNYVKREHVDSSRRAEHRHHILLRTDLSFHTDSEKLELANGVIGSYTKRIVRSMINTKISQKTSTFFKSYDQSSEG